MLWTLIALASHAATCEPVDIRHVASIPPPAALVLGVRHGSQPDLYRASRVVGHLRRSASVRVALDAIPVGHQEVLDRYAARRIEPEDLEQELDWAATWGFPYPPYARLLAHARHGVEIVGIGNELERAPGHDEVAVPSGYTDVLRDAMSGHEVPLEMEHAFVEYAAWRDLRVAELSASGWDGEGYLVIVAERGQVQGGKGISWQAEEVVEAPVHAVVLAPGACADGDRVWFPRALGWLGAEPEPPAR